MTTNIATILTVHNRREKTLRSLAQLFAAYDAYQEDGKKAPLHMSVFLTDDGCTDGTPEAVMQSFAGRDIRIIAGDGTLFWAGGMRKAWREALDDDCNWDYFLLINDDTYVHPHLFDELLACNAYCLERYGQQGIYSGVTCASTDGSTITYGGEVFEGWAKHKKRLLHPTGTPQMVELTHANVLLVPRAVVSAIGIFYEGYQHSGADNDYSMTARRKHIPVLVTGHICATCDNDHQHISDEAVMLQQMPYGERKRYLSQPPHSDDEYLLFVRRTMLWKLPLAWVIRKLRLFFPVFYYRFTHARGAC